MRNRCHHILFLLFALVSITAMAQDETDTVENSMINETPPRQKQYYLFNPRVSITVPHPLANEAFNKSFVGIYEINACFNVMLYKGFFAGLNYKNGLLKITENKIPDYNASMLMNSIAGKIGSDFFIVDKNNIILSIAVSAGQNRTKYSSFVSKVPNTQPQINGFKSSYFEPEANLFFLVEENFGVGVTLTYSVIKRNFDPYELCLNEWTQYPKDNSGATRYLSFGFGFYYGLSKKITK